MPPEPPILFEDGPDPEEIRKAKRDLRREVAARIRAMSAEERAAESARVCELVADSPEYVSARSILMYHALEDEVDLGTLIDDAIHSGREVLLPVVGEGRGSAGEAATPSRSREMSVCSVGDPARDLREGVFGIMEPRGGMPLEDLSQIGLVLAPGRAFDREGGRLGRGGGYYDRFLRRLRPRKAGGPPKIGVAFACQVVEAVPRTGMDVLMDGLVREGGLTRRY